MGRGPKDKRCVFLVDGRGKSEQNSLPKKNEKHKIEIPGVGAECFFDILLSVFFFLLSVLFFCCEDPIICIRGTI